MTIEEIKQKIFELLIYPNEEIKKVRAIFEEREQLVRTLFNKLLEIDSILFHESRSDITAEDACKQIMEIIRKP